ncbi:MAG: hypothetical protein AB4426_01895 [Xenococcaceae cyanobacterium]
MLVPLLATVYLLTIYLLLTLAQRITKITQTPSGDVSQPSSAR